MSDLYRSSRRCYLIDHHSPAPPAVTLDHLDISEYENFFDTAQIDSVMVYCKDHWGMVYYDSKVPGSQKHPGIRGDWIRTARDSAARKNLEFIAYYCIEYDEGAARRFPQWRVLQADGTPLIRDDLYAKWSLCCYQTGYREYSLSHIEEIVRNYHPDALFLDIFGASLCYCEHCRSKFQKLFGYEIPETEEDIKLHRRDLVSFLNKNAYEYLSELRARAKAIDPSIAITINFSCHYPKEIRDLLDYQFSEPLMKDNWFSSAYARDTASGQFPILAPGEASQVYNYDREEQYICDLSSIAAQGCRVGMYSGSQHADGTLEHLEAERLGSVYSILKDLEPYFKDRYPVKSIGILQSDASKSINAMPFYSDAILRMKKHNPHTFAILGAMQLCEQMKFPYGILPEGEVTAEQLAQYDMIILPEVYVITDSTADLLKKYVSNGGKLLISGKTGLWDTDFNPLNDFVLSDLMGVSFSKINTEYMQNTWSAYIKKSADSSFSGIFDRTTPPVSDFFIETSCTDAHPEFNFILPCVACSSTDWVNWWSPPPGEENDYPALTVNQYGKGSVVYTAFDFFTMAAQESYRNTADLFKQITDRLQIDPVLRNITDIPDILRTAFFETGSCYQIHQVSQLAHQFKGNVTPVSGGLLSVSAPVKEAIVVYPEYRRLPITQNNGKWMIQLPDFNIQQFVLLTK